MATHTTEEEILGMSTLKLVDLAKPCDIDVLCCLNKNLKCYDKSTILEVISKFHHEGVSE